MLKLRSGISSLVHWIRVGRAASSVTRAVDRAGLQRDLQASRPELDLLLAQVAENGVAAIPRYWTAQKCEDARAAFDRVLSDHPGSIQLYSRGSDQRLYGMESADPLFAEFHDDTFLKGFGELDGGLELYNFATLGGRIQSLTGNSGSGDGWHRDAHGYQFKAILYLSDAGLENGPFQYLLGSHRRWQVAIDTMFGDLPEAPQTRYTDQDIARATARLHLSAQSFPASAGTVLLVNTAGIHRGMPLMAGTRYALTNYYYNPAQINEERIAQFSPLLPGTAERIRGQLL